MTAAFGEPRFFETREAFRAWLEENGATQTELVVLIYKKSAGKQGLTRAEMVDELLCFGWIDGVGRPLDDERFGQRVTPRKARSTWSAFNIRRFGELAAEGRVTEAGREAFARRTEENSRKYSYENGPMVLDDASAELLHGTPEAERFFAAQAPWYQRTVRHWVMTAKKPETKRRRLEQLIAESAAGRRLRQFVSPDKR